MSDEQRDIFFIRYHFSQKFIHFHFSFNKFEQLEEIIQVSATSFNAI